MRVDTLLSIHASDIEEDMIAEPEKFSGFGKLDGPHYLYRMSGSDYRVISIFDSKKQHLEDVSLDILATTICRYLHSS